jgi:hypothetical protein
MSEVCIIIKPQSVKELSMSVSFYPSSDNTVAHVINCICRETNLGVVYPDYESAWDAKKNSDLKPNCGDIYCDYLYVKPQVEEPEVQMSNSNAVDLLDVLGLIEEGADFSDYCVGSMPAQDFLGRVLVAKAVAPESAERLPESQGNIHYGGREAGYVQAKLERMQEMAEWAIANQRKVIWS